MIGDTDLNWIEELCSQGVRENSFLEFKSGELLNVDNVQNAVDSIAKEVVAFCNSGGGRLIIGIDEKEGRANKIVSIKAPKRNSSWLYQSLQSRIHPWIETLEVAQIEVTGSEFLLVLEVPRSNGTVHQAGDNKFYSRRGEHKLPMLPFEIDDVRRRAFSQTSEITVAVKARSGLLTIELVNEGEEAFSDVWLAGANIDTKKLIEGWHPGLEAPYLKPFRRIERKEAKTCLLNGYEYLESVVGDEVLEMELTYSDQIGKIHTKRFKFYLSDYNTVRQDEPIVEAVKDGFSRVSKNLESLKELARSVEVFVEEAVEPSGLVLSQSTLKSLTNRKLAKRNPLDLSYRAIAELLEVDIETALKVHHEVFGYLNLIGRDRVKLVEIDLPEEIKERVAERIQLPEWMLAK